MADIAGSTEIGKIHYALDLDSKKFDSGLDKADGKFKGLTGMLKSAEAGSKAFAAGLAIAGAALTAISIAGIKSAASLETMRSGFITLLGSAEKADEALQMIKKDATTTPFEMAGLVQANQLLTSVTKDAGRSEKMLLNVGKALAAMGKGQPELDRIIVNLQQVGAVGKAAMMDVKQFAFAGIPIFEMLSQATGKTGEALSDFITDGGVTFEMLEKMFNDAGMAGGRFENAFRDQAGTFNQLWSNMKDNLSIAGAEFVKQTGIFDLAKKALGIFIKFLDENLPKIIEGIKNFTEIMKNNLPIVIGIIVGALIPAFVAWAGAAWAAAAGVWAALAPLLPFIAAGAALGAIVQLLLNHFGGWQGIMERLQPYINAMKPIIELLKGAFQALIQTLKEQLLPLWNDQLKPALIALWPLFKLIATIIGVVIVGSIMAGIASFVILIGILTGVLKFVATFVTGVVQFFSGLWQFISGWWGMIYGLFTGNTELVRASVEKMKNGIISIFSGLYNAVYGSVKSLVEGIFGFFKNLYDNLIGHSIIPDIVNGIVDWFRDLPSRLVGALGGVYDAVTTPFRNAFEWIKGKVGGVKEALEKINPFHRESPSLVDNIKAGTAQIIGQYQDMFSGITDMTGGIRPELQMAATAPMKAPEINSAGGGRTENHFHIGEMLGTPQDFSTFVEKVSQEQSRQDRAKGGI